ncbi:MAG: hypothetical protein HXY23_15240, partial [Parvularculaceae bacterium]|nr:hypothetical protein [Parvularculaceae bacterium]
ARAEILYPAPARLPEGGMESIGYSSDVVFPLEISAENPDQPMRLVIDVEFGVCKDICMPVSGTLSVTLPGANEEHGPLIAAHLARVPLAAKPGDAAIKDVRVVRKKDRRMLVIAASFPTVDGSGDLFLDDPEGGPAPLTRRLDQTGGRFEADLGPPGDWARLNGKKLRATLVSSQGQCWTLITLPAQ